MSGTSLRMILLPVATAALVAAIPACGEDEKEDPGAAAKEAFTTDFCEIMKPCCTGLDPAACKKTVTDLDPAMLGDETARQRCLTQLRAVAALSDFCSELGNLDVSACPDARRKATTGAKKPGDPCTADTECAPSFDGPVACKTVCQVTKRGKDGDGPCVATIEEDVTRPVEGAATGPTAFACYLRDGLSCDNGTKKCIKPAAVGGACADHDACVRTAYCDEGKCVTRRGNGNSCTEDRECQATAHCEANFCAAGAPAGAPQPSPDVRLEAMCRPPATP